MTISLNPQIKHRIVGVVVLVAIAIVFLPAMLKKSNYRLDQSTAVSVRLPPKPTTPKVVLKDETAMFQTVKVASVTIETPKEVPQLPKIIQAKPIRVASNLVKPAVVSKSATQSAAVRKPPPRKLAAKTTQPRAQRVAAKPLSREVYAVQLASFAQMANAKSLVARLQNQGYKARLTKSGTMYKVVVGGLAQRQEAISLQKKLAANLQLQGFIVKTGVG